MAKRVRTLGEIGSNLLTEMARQGKRIFTFEDAAKAYGNSSGALREAIEFYKRKHGWSNRLIAFDSLLVMNSLIGREGLAGQVQMIYIDPPYGIKPCRGSLPTNAPHH